MHRNSLTKRDSERRGRFGPRLDPLLRKQLSTALHPNPPQSLSDCAAISLLCCRMDDSPLPLSATFPPPPPHHALFTNDNLAHSDDPAMIRQLQPPRVDWIQQDGGYDLFGDFYPVRLPSLAAVCRETGLLRASPSLHRNTPPPLSLTRVGHGSLTPPVARLACHYLCYSADPGPCPLSRRDGPARPDELSSTPSPGSAFAPARLPPDVLVPPPRTHQAAAAAASVSAAG